MKIVSTFLTAIIFLQPAAPGQSTSYDPSKTAGKVTVSDTEFSYGTDKRIVPLRIYLPESSSPAPVVLFSHGLGGSRENNKYLGNHWAGRGYSVVVIQHAGSDTNVIRNAPRFKKIAALKAAANGRSAVERCNDVKETLNHLQSLNSARGDFENRFDMEKVGMSGHSFGAVTTQAVSGQNYGRQGKLFTDSRIDAAVAFSPSPPAYGDDTGTFDKVKIPWLLMTGTKDKSMIGNRTDPESRRLVFQQLPDADMFYELVFDGGEHLAFSDRQLGPQDKRNPNHHLAIQAISSAFWDTYLRRDKDAKEWLHGSGPRELLDEADVWQKK